MNSIKRKYISTIWTIRVRSLFSQKRYHGMPGLVTLSLNVLFLIQSWFSRYRISSHVQYNTLPLESPGQNYILQTIYARCRIFFLCKKKMHESPHTLYSGNAFRPSTPPPPFACCSLEYDRPTPSLILLEIWWYFNAWLRNKIEIELDF